MNAPQGLSDEVRYVSSGHLPATSRVPRILQEALEAAREITDGEVSEVYPALARVDRDLLGLCLVSVEGDDHEVGDARHHFTMMSVAKPFTFALVAEHRGVDEITELTGSDATGLPFDSLEAIERGRRGRTNPMVNPGAIAATSLAPGEELEDRWRFLLDGFSAFAGHRLDLDDEVYDSSRSSNARNRAIAVLLDSYGAISGDAHDAAELYTRQSAVRFTCAELAVMGATLAAGGVNPVTGERVVGQEVARAALAMMTVSGMYETSGSWLLDVGMPGKTGISGAMVTVSPGKGALAVYAPPLDEAGNSVRGQAATRLLARRLGLDVLAAAAE